VPSRFLKNIPTDRNNATDEKLLSVVPPRRDFYPLGKLALFVKENNFMAK
jgi:hypothetical protein